MLFSGEVKAARRVPNEADLQWAYLRFLPTLNNPLIGAAARREVGSEAKNNSGF
jgi:hypothetical protein